MLKPGGPTAPARYSQPVPELQAQLPGGRYLTTLRITGVVPITRNEYGKKRQSYKDWVGALRGAADRARDGLSESADGPYSLRIEMRLYSPWDQGSDLDNFIKDVQDALADAGVFGIQSSERSPMTGDERVDHLEVRRTRVSTVNDAGVIAEVWTID